MQRISNRCIPASVKSVFIFSSIPALLRQPAPPLISNRLPAGHWCKHQHAVRKAALAMYPLIQNAIML